MTFLFILEIVLIVCFILTIWNVNVMLNGMLAGFEQCFILTIWNVNYKKIEKDL
ncbi:hypothetical protein CDFC105_01526 [Clostridioides difficile]|nr:hypothetical protein CDFC105_01526 [Clostridioides difficile]